MAYFCLKFGGILKKLSGNTGFDDLNGFEFLKAAIFSVKEQVVK